MRALLALCLFTAACKDGSAPSPTPADKPTPTEVEAKASPNARARPTLPDQPGEADDDEARPHLPDGAREPRDWSDPAVREEMRAQREERRKQREAMLDTNHDGVVSPQERQQRMLPVLERLDSNGDGKLTVDELAKTESRRMHFDDPAAVDTNKNGEISLAELDAAVTARRAEMRAAWRGAGAPGSGSAE